MSLPIGIIVLIALVWITIHTISYSLWNWKNKNKVGAIMVFLVSIFSIVIPVYLVFFRT